MNQKISLSLMYLGLIPFLLCAFWVSSGQSEHLFGLVARDIAASYTLLIGSFMAGIHWGQHIDRAPVSPTFLAVFSNVITLAFWFSFLFAPFEIYMVISAVLFLLILGLDTALMKMETLEKHYGYSRIAVTSLVALSLVSMGISS